MPLIDRARAFAAAQDFVRTKIQPSDLMSIMTANDSVKVIQDFSGDHDDLLRTLDQLMSDSGPESSAAADADQQLTRLHTVVNMLGSMKGKKAVVYFSMPSTRSDSPGTAAINRCRHSRQRGILQRGRLRPDNAFAGQPCVYDQPKYTLQIRVAQQQGVSGTYSVRPDGRKISVPMIGEIRAAEADDSAVGSGDRGPLGDRWRCRPSVGFGGCGLRFIAIDVTLEIVFRRIIWIVLDSAGIGAMPDAASYGEFDSGSDTIGNIARIRGLNLPNLARLGLGNIKPLAGIPPSDSPAAYGRCTLASPGKDTTTGHWEMVGIHLAKPFPLFPHGFPPAIMHEFETRIGRRLARQ